MSVTWIVVANRAVAHLYETASRVKAPTHIISIPNEEGRLMNHELKSDDSGRVKHESQKGRNKYQPPKEPTEVVTARFAREISHHLEKALNENRFQHLVLVAEASFLGELRAVLPGQLGKIVTQSIDKDLANGSSRQLAERLKEEVDITLL